MGAKAKKFMKAGYERQEQNYRHKDGSYSIWGPKDEDAEGSVWLTAFVVKAFAQASDYIDIDQDKLRQSIGWLKRKQNPDGCFENSGYSYKFDKDSNVALTASLVIAQLDSSLAPEPEKVEEVVESMKCLQENVKDSSSVYVKALSAYAFALMGETKSEVTDKWLEHLTISQDQADDKVNFCASYTGTKEKTNMVVIEVELLSGFVPTKDALLSLKNTKAIKKVEYDEKENNIALYFNDMSKSQFCYDFQVQEKNKVEDRQDALAKIYDYYDQNDAFSTKYNISQ